MERNYFLSSSSIPVPSGVENSLWMAVLMSHNRITIKKDDVFGYAVIICRLGDYTDKDSTMYAVKKSCCGEHVELSHTNLLVIRDKHRLRCRACETKRREGAPRKGRAWTHAEDAIIHKLWPAHDRDIRMALLEAGFERTIRAIQQHRIGILGLGEHEEDEPEHKAETRKVTAIVIPPPTPGLGVWDDARRHWWPSLGVMGPRHGTTGRY